MTAKDFIAIAAMLSSSRVDALVAGQPHDNRTRLAMIDAMALRMADTFSAKYPRFDRARFLTAAGYGA